MKGFGLLSTLAVGCKVCACICRICTAAFEAGFNWRRCVCLCVQAPQHPQLVRRDEDRHSAQKGECVLARVCVSEREREGEEEIERDCNVHVADPVCCNVL